MTDELAVFAHTSIGVASGSLAWWAILVSGVAFARHAVGHPLLVGINIVSGETPPWQLAFPV